MPTDSNSTYYQNFGIPGPNGIDHHFDPLRSGSNEETPQWLNVTQTSKDLKRTRNRLAQRKSRERRREEANIEDSRDPERRRERSGSSTFTAPPHGALLRSSSDQPDAPSRMFFRDIQRADSPGEIPINMTLPPDQMGLAAAGLNLLPVDTSNDAYSSNQGLDAGGKNTHRHHIAFDAFSIASPYRAESSALGEDPLQRPSYPGVLQYPDQYMSSTNFLPIQVPSYGTRDTTYQSQRHEPQLKQIAYQSPCSSAKPSENLNSVQFLQSGLEAEIRDQASAHTPNSLEEFTHIQPHSSSSYLETRFQRILDVVEEAGFDSIDAMAAEYYSAEFRFLETLHTSSKDWGRREAQSYREGIIRSAERIYVKELLLLRQQSSPRNNTATGKQRTCIAEKIQQLFLDVDYNRMLKQDKHVFRQQMPEIWSLLTELTRMAELPQSQGPQIVCAFLYMLTVLK